MLDESVEQNDVVSLEGSRSQFADYPAVDLLQALGIAATASGCRDARTQRIPIHDVG